VSGKVMSVKAEVSPRAELLDEAKELVTGSRNNEYGPPDADFTRTAAMLTALGFTFNGDRIHGHHVGLAMICLKLSRAAWYPGKRDTLTDIAGYAACTRECVVLDPEVDTD